MLHCTEKTVRMDEYWFVIDAIHEDLYEALKPVLGRRPGFHLIKERRRRRSGVGPEGRERRRAHVWQGEGISIAARCTLSSGVTRPA